MHSSQCTCKGWQYRRAGHCRQVQDDASLPHFCPTVRMRQKNSSQASGKGAAVRNRAAETLHALDNFVPSCRVILLHEIAEGVCTGGRKLDFAVDLQAGCTAGRAARKVVHMVCHQRKVRRHVATSGRAPRASRHASLTDAQLSCKPCQRPRIQPPLHPTLIGSSAHRSAGRLQRWWRTGMSEGRPAWRGVDNGEHWMLLIHRGQAPATQQLLGPQAGECMRHWPCRLAVLPRESCRGRPTSPAS